MRGTVLYGPYDVRFEERKTPTIIKSTDAIVTMSAAARRKRTIAHLPKRTRKALGKQASKIARGRKPEEARRRETGDVQFPRLYAHLREEEEQWTVHGFATDASPTVASEVE